MDGWLNKLVHASNGRYFSPDEAERIVEYAETLPDRLSAARQFEDARRWLTRHMTDAIGPKAAGWGIPREPFAQDFLGSLTPVVTAMLLDDPAALAEAVVTPFESLAASLDVPAAEVAELFDDAWQGLAGRLDPNAVGLLAPYFAAVADGLRRAEPALNF